MSGSTSSTQTHDANGNMTSDGTNSYSWDAEDRLTQITYSPTNYTIFNYDMYSRIVSVQETVAGVVTSTKQFMWLPPNDLDDSDQSYQPAEERDSSGALTKTFHSQGQVNSGTKYFYLKDHLRSVKVTSDVSANPVSIRMFSAFGKATIASETVSPDFGFAGYYFHSRSGLNFTLARAYNSTLGRFSNRDPIKEDGGINLYAYCNNNPVNETDPSGLICCSSGGGGDDPDPPEPKRDNRTCRQKCFDRYRACKRKCWINRYCEDYGTCIAKCKATYFRCLHNCKKKGE